MSDISHVSDNKVVDNKEIIYCNRVRIGNWYETSTLEEYKLNVFLEQMKKGGLMLARFRKMTENLNTPTILTQSTGTISFGSKISLYAPHVPNVVAGPTNVDKKGILLGGRITSDDIPYSQNLEDGCSVVGLPYSEPTQRNAFILTSADYCDRAGEQLKFNQEFRLTLASSVDKQPLYIRYDLDPIPGLCGLFPLYLSKNYVSNTRWRVLPAQRPNITRFEQEGNVVPVNEDIVINHCATNLNLGIRLGCFATGFYGKICAPMLKTCLDNYGRELPNNIWQIHTPIAHF